MPTDKRARHKAARQAKMAELRRAQQRRRNMKRGGVVAVIVVIALVLALYSGGVFKSGSKHKTNVATKGATTTTTPTTAPAPTTTVPADGAKPLALSKVEQALTARSAPAKGAACANPETGPKGSASTTTTTVPASGKAVATIAAPAGVGFPKLNGSAPHYTKFTAAPPYCIDQADTYTATMRTTAGTIVIKLLPKYAPLTVNNFVFLAGYHYFDGIVFHRVIPGFVDQGGDPTGTGTGGPGYEFADELPKSRAAYDAGAVAMANSGANTNGSQFFLIDGDGGAELTPAYTMFGQITSGLSVADKINAEGTSSGTPKTLNKMLSVTISVKA